MNQYVEQGGVDDFITLATASEMYKVFKDMLAFKEELPNKAFEQFKKADLKHHISGLTGSVPLHQKRVQDVLYKNYWTGYKLRDLSSPLDEECAVWLNEYLRIKSA